MPPRTLIFFGPSRTGKTHFVRAIAEVLQWWNVEVSPSDLMAEGQDRLGTNLKREYAKEGDCLVTTETFMELIPQISPTLNKEIIKDFEQDCEKYFRY